MPELFTLLFPRAWELAGRQLSYLCTGVEKKGIWALTQDFLRLLSDGLKVRVSGAAGSRRVGEQREKVRQESRPGRSECCEGIREKMPPNTHL